MNAQRADIEVTTDEGRFSAYLSVPANPNGVAVVVLQEIFGVNANIRTIVDGFADAGYAAIAPDLYWRQQPGIQLDPGSEDGRAQAMELMKGLSRDQAVADGAAALGALLDRAEGLGKSAAVGYCFGGGVAYLMAARGEVDAGVAYYGTGLQTMLGELDGLTGTVLLHIAAEDHICPPEAQEAIKTAAAKTDGHATVVVHPGVGHAFARIGGAAFDQHAADRANQMTMDVLAGLSA